MRLTAAGYGALVQEVVHAVPAAAVALVTEGGYNLAALADCLEASFRVIDGRSTSPVGGGQETAGGAPRGERALKAARAVHAPYWRGI
jgi:acetoin utilization deacetylase AcuC-like enzyme